MTEIRSLIESLTEGFDDAITVKLGVSSDEVAIYSHIRDIKMPCTDQWDYLSELSKHDEMYKKFIAGIRTSDKALTTQCQAELDQLGAIFLTLIKAKLQSFVTQRDNNYKELLQKVKGEQ
jgi:hypothetical protein